jgi:hypothetical protein
MRKLATIGIAVVALGGPLAQGAGAMPADVSPVVHSPIVVVKPLPAAPLRLGLSQHRGVEGMSAAEKRAFTLSGQALNRQYGLGTFVPGPTLAELRADRLRGQALNRKYGLGTETPNVTSSSRFEWGDAGIGAAVLLGIVALLGAGLFEARHHGRLGTS